MKIPALGGFVGGLICQPCINMLRVDDKSDFLLLGCKKIKIIFKI